MNILSIKVQDLAVIRVGFGMSGYKIIWEKHSFLKNSFGLIMWIMIK